MRRDRTSYQVILLAALSGALLLTLAYQIPVVHQVDIGGFDSAYLNGFFEPERASAPDARAYLDGSDGSARWTRAESSLLFPQAGLPAQLTLRMRGHPNASPTSPTQATILVNGIQAAQVSLGPEWQEQSIPITGGLTKPEDVLITIRSATLPAGDGDLRQVGVLLDQAKLTVGPFPILPYPLQLMYAAFASGLLALFMIGSKQAQSGLHGVVRSVALGMVLLALAFLLLYRMQPPYPWPLRGMLLWVALGLAALTAIQRAEWLWGIRHLPDVLALSAIAGWIGVLLLLAQGHLVLSVPGVEKDFRVFATRDTPATIFAADGFYNLGYPLLLWLVRPMMQGSAFLAARLISVLAGGALLLAVWSLARMRLGAWSAVAAVAVCALSPFVVQYSLYLGSDMPFAACCAWALVFLTVATDSGSSRRALTALAAAGMLGGMAFLIRHPGLVVLPLAWMVILMQGASFRRARGLGLVTLAFVLVLSPQLWVNLRDTGQLLYSQQAKNIWLAVFGGGDWGRWGEASNDVALSAVIAQDPGRFWENFAGNLRAYVGSGAEDTSEFGRAIQLRLVGFPANWLAIAGLSAWLWKLVVMMVGRLRGRGDGGVADLPGAGDLHWLRQIPAVPLLWVLLYVPAIAVGFALPRFFLPLGISYALAAAYAAYWVGQRLGGARAHLGILLLLVILLWGGFAAGSSYVLRPVAAGSDIPGQPDTTLSVAQRVLSELGPGERLVIRTPIDDEPGQALVKYSALAHLAIPTAADSVAQLEETGAALLVWSDRLGPVPQLGSLIGRAGPYTIWRISRGASR